MDSILTSVKKMLGIAEEYTHFDGDLIMHINSVFSVLTQIGVGPSEGFSISDEHAIWEDFMEPNPKFNSIKTYIYQKVRLMFDPPVSSAHLTALNESIKEFEWRLNLTAETEPTGESEV